jgi:hypothetical protein
MKPNDKIKYYSVDHYEETDNGYEVMAVHPNGSNPCKRRITLEQIGAHLLVDGQGNVTTWTGDLDAEPILVPLEEHLREMGMIDKEVLLCEVLNKVEQRTISVKKPLPQLPNIGLQMVSAAEAANESSRTSQAVSNLLKTVDGIKTAA